MRKYLYFTVFISGMTSLAAEFGASRLLGNVFGTSEPGLGSHHRTHPHLLDRWVLPGWALGRPLATTKNNVRYPGLGSLYVGVVPYVAGPVLRLAANAVDNLQIGIIAGVFAGVLILFTIPVTLMGMISPFAIRLTMNDAGHAGNTAGTIYGISTIGSFIGTFLPTLLLIPTIGTTHTFLVFSLTLLLVALVGLGLSAGRQAVLPGLFMLAVLVWLALLQAAAVLKSSGQIYETEVEL